MPKTIAILAPSAVPYEVGGAEKLWWGMQKAFTGYAHAFVDLIKLPCREKSFLEILDAYEAFSRLDLSHFDMLVTTKYPAWIARHPNHVCYLQHTLRGLYDTYNTTGLPETLAKIPGSMEQLLTLVRKPDPTREDLPLAFDLARTAAADHALPRSMFAFPGPLIREIVHFFDRIALAPGEIKAYLAISGNVAGRKDYFPTGADIKILPHPSDLEGFKCEPGRYFFTASRLHSNKRIKLIAEAMRHVPLDIPLKIAGTGPELNALKEHYAGDKRIEFLGYVPDREMIDLYSGAICVPYAPLDEDYGLITIEAMQSGKPVITTPDAGGVCEFVEDGKTGYIVPPFPPDMGAAMTRLGRDPGLAAALGANAREKTASITWENTIAKFMEHAGSPGGSIKPVLLVLAPFRPQKDGAGGPRRLYHFVKELAKNYTVRLVCYGSQTSPGPVAGWLDETIRETVLPWPEEMLDEARKNVLETGQSSDDIGILRKCANDRLFADYLHTEGRDALGVILSHPWLYPAVAKELPHLPLFYDAHNVEADMKEAVFGAGPVSEEVKSLEKEVCAKASRIFPCSETDAARFQEIYGVKSAILTLLPNGAEITSENPDRKRMRKRLAYPDQSVVLFTGSDHRPNADAALEIFKLAQSLPDVQFLLVGSVCSSPFVSSKPCPANVHLLGHVSENIKNTLLARADLALNPVVSGSGVNLKITEYLGYGTPCISTPFGARGMPPDLAPALHIVPLEEFTDRIRVLLSAPPDQDQIDRIAEHIRTEFAWKNTLAPLAGSIKTALQQDKASASVN